MALRDAANDLAAALEGADLGLARPAGSPPSGGNLFTSPLPEADGDGPDTCVALVNTGGAPAQPYLAAGTRRAYYTPTVQVRIRSGVEDFQAGQTLAHAVLEALNLLQLAPYSEVACETSAPAYFGPDGGGRHRWSFDVRLGYVSAP